MKENSLLLHACCGPCAITPILRFLDEGRDVTLWFMNPNIHPLQEYLRRREGVYEVAQKLGVALIFDDVAWNLSEWLGAQLPRAESPERCRWCCVDRLTKTRQKARALGFAAFSTTLLYSIYQPHEIIAQAGKRLAEQEGPAFLYRDFRITWREGANLSREWNIYRQPYCGCLFSERERYAKKFTRTRAEYGDIFPARTLDEQSENA